jgi:hypothetical protein
MVDLYFTLIKYHIRTLSDVPEALQSEVQAKLAAAGIDASLRFTSKKRFYFCQKS